MNRKEEKTKKKINIKNKKGITLIALVITIIVLLILAGVSIAMLTGQNGILTQASKAKIEQSHAAVKEAIRLEYNEWKIEVETSSNVKLASTEIISIQGEKEEAKSGTTETFFDYLVSKRYVDSTTKIINVEKLTGSKQALGNGTGTDDVYKLVEQNGEYEIVYYENGTTNTVIDTITNTTADDDNWDAIATDPKYFTFTFNEEDKTAVLTGVKEKYAVKGYYNEEWFPAAIIDGDTQITDIIIPEHAYDTSGTKYTITEIGDKAFRFYSTIEYKSLFTSIKLPNTIRVIGKSAFEDCELLVNFNIPELVTEIKDRAFYGCEKLRSVEISGDLTSIGNSAFFGCISIESIYIPESVKQIGEMAFGAWTDKQIINFEVTKEQEGWDQKWYHYDPLNPQMKAQVNWGVSM